MGKVFVLLVSTLMAALGLSMFGCQMTDCDDLARKATSLVNAAATCKAGDVCEVVAMGALVNGSCMGAFQCIGAMRKGSDKADFRAEAQAIEDEHANCNVCVMASCLPAHQFDATCDTDKGRCELVLK